MCLAVALTAARLGATVTNYTEVTELIKTRDGFVGGAKIKDGVTGRTEFNATQQVFVTVAFV